MFRKLKVKLITIFILVFGLMTVQAQQIDPSDSTSNHSAAKKTQTREFNQNEFYGGYSYQRFDSEYSTNGFELAYTRNVRRYLGFKADFSYRSANLFCPECGPGGTEKQSQLSFQGGIQIKDNARSTRLKPFAHLLTGWAQHRGQLCEGPNNCGPLAKGNHFSLKVGGGLDIKVSRRIDIRVIQFDYNPTFSAGFRYHNFNLGAGIVIH